MGHADGLGAVQDRALVWKADLFTEISFRSREPQEARDPYIHSETAIV